jgi:NAD+ kinase
MKINNTLVVYARPTSTEQKNTISLVQNTLKKHKIKHSISDRNKLNKNLFRNKDLIIAVGGDGTFLMASQFIFDNTLMFGVNSDPRFKEGFFMVCEKKDFRNKLKKIIDNKFTKKKIDRLEAYISNKKIQELALNEFYVASEKDYHTARYFLNVKGRKERQKSSGVLVSTAAGSNAWIKSAGGKVLPLNSDKFEYLVREPYCGNISTKCSLVNDVLSYNEKIGIVFEVGNGILIADSLSKEHKFKSGQKVVIKISKKPLCVASFNNNSSRI